MKLIVPAVALLAVAVGAAAFFSLTAIDDLARREAEVRRRAGEEAMQRQSELIARNAASSAGLPLADGNFTYLDSLVTSTVKEDSRIEWILIADAGSNRVVSRSAGAPSFERLDDDLAREVLAAGAGRVIRSKDSFDRTRFTFGTRIQVGERVVGQLRLGVSTAALEADLARSIAAAGARARATTRKLGLVAVFILLAGVAMAAFQGVRITRPLAALSRQAHRIAGGELEHRVAVSSRDEIGQLAEDFNFMAGRLGALIAETASRASLEREMSLARAVQESMIPPRELMQHGSLRVIGHCVPATTCGGDWWTARPLTGGRLLVVVGDVTGHGIPSAIVAANARGAVEALAKVDEALLTPEQVLHAIDSAIRGVGAEQLLMTCFTALLDASAGTIWYANAAHNFPYILRMDDTRTLAKIGVLAVRGSPLGQQGTLVLESGRRDLSPGDTLVFFSDGVIDRVDGSGNRFGDRRLRGLLLGRKMSPAGGGIPAMRDEIVEKMDAFAGGAPADDDVTLVLCQYDPRAASVAAGREAVG